MPPGLSERELSPRGFGTSHGTHDSIQNSVSQYVLYVTIDARSALQAGLLHDRPPPTVLHACLVQAVLWTCLVQVVLRTRASHLPRFFPSPPIPLSSSHLPPSSVFQVSVSSSIIFRASPPPQSASSWRHGARETRPITSISKSSSAAPERWRPRPFCFGKLRPLIFNLQSSLISISIRANLPPVSSLTTARSVAAALSNVLFLKASSRCGS